MGRFVGHSRGAARNEHPAESRLAALLRFSPHDADVDVRPLQVPAPGIAGPVFRAIEHVLSASLVVLGNESDSVG